MKKVIIVICLVAWFTGISWGQMTKYGKLIEFTLQDRAANPRQVQVFIPGNLDRQVPAKVIWYFRGKNGVRLTWNIETSRLYLIGYVEKAVIVAPNLFKKVWSKGTDETDYYLIHDLITHLKKLVDENGASYKLDMENMVAAGFSAGGGFCYHLAGLYPKIFAEIVFKKFLSHCRPLVIKADQAGKVLDGLKNDIQAYSDLKEAFHSVYAKEKPLFMLSVGLPSSARKAGLAVQEVSATRDLLAGIGYKTTLITVPKLQHRFLANYSEDFKRQISEFFFPIHITNPTSRTIWKITLLAPTMVKITWQTLPQVGSKVHLDLISVKENKSYALGRNLDNSGVFQADPHLLPARTGRFFIKISTADKLHVNYSDSFMIEYESLTPKL
jgi:dienelactone hydrolase